jgi:hypothetical protein
MNSCRESCPTVLSLHSVNTNVIVSAIYIDNINNVRNCCPCYLRYPALIDRRSIMKHVSWRSCDWETAQRFGGLECLLLQVEQQLWCILFFPPVHLKAEIDPFFEILVFLTWYVGRCSKLLTFNIVPSGSVYEFLDIVHAMNSYEKSTKSRDFLAVRKTVEMGATVMYIFRKLQNALRWDKATRLSEYGILHVMFIFFQGSFQSRFLKCCSSGATYIVWL